MDVNSPEPLQPIEKGQRGWKVRRLDMLIMETMDRATQPNTGWDIYQKIKRDISVDGDYICLRMKALSDRGYLQMVGDADPDCGWFYSLPDCQSDSSAGVERRVLQWLAGPNTGLSSECMAFCAIGLQRTDSWAKYAPFTPADPADLNRCLMLVEQIPEVKDAFPKIAALSDDWKIIIDNWESLKESFVSEVGWNWSEGTAAPVTYKVMKELTA